MTDNIDQIKEFTSVVERFVRLANEMKNESKGLTTIIAALVSAAATYGSCVAAGNEGYLKPSGVDKLVDANRRHALRVQDLKRESIQRSGKTAG
jgi:hypothetical protein